MNDKQGNYLLPMGFTFKRSLKQELNPCVRVAPDLRTRCPVLGELKNPCFYFLERKFEKVYFFNYAYIFDKYIEIFAKIG